MASVSIIIRCLNEEKHIGRLLSGILEQTIKDVEIIVVDSGSQDATLSIASRYQDQIIQIRPQDFSFGYALN
ncbi:MAG: glycosyltransferase, partial [Saprospiraceae bacterium]|nr:glycosyltransferase [Saprospiraceae bacterium]